MVDSVDPSHPVVIGVAACHQRSDDPTQTVSELDLMVRAVQDAVTDAGGTLRTSDIGFLAVAQGSWSHAGPGRYLKDRLGCADARTAVANLGILQSQLVHLVAERCRDGELEVGVVVGGEARHRAIAAARAGVELPADTTTEEPDEAFEPDSMVIHALEIEHRLVDAVQHYAMLETARRAADGLSPEAHAAEVASLGAAMNRVAVGNEDAWNRTPRSAEWLATPSADNRPLSHPYLKWHSTQWNVDQAGALVITTAGKASELGVPRDQWVFLRAGTISNDAAAVVERPQLHRCPGAAITARAAAAHAGVGLADLTLVDLYSCFPIAVRIQQRELGLSDDVVPTVTGGMAFAGGPFNNYVLQSTVKMVETLRAGDGEPGLVSAVSGMLTKQGMTILSTTPPPGEVVFEDRRTEVAEATPRRAVDGDAEGDGSIVGYTVIAERDADDRLMAVVDVDSGARTLAATTDLDAVAVATTEELVGRRVRVASRSLHIH